MAKKKISVSTLIKSWLQAWDSVAVSLATVATRNEALYNAGVTDRAKLVEALVSIGQWPVDDKGKPLGLRKMQEEGGKLAELARRSRAYDQWLRDTGRKETSKKKSTSKRSGKVVSLSKIEEGLTRFIDTLPKRRQAKAVRLWRELRELIVEGAK